MGLSLLDIQLSMMGDLAPAKVTAADCGGAAKGGGITDVGGTIGAETLCGANSDAADDRGSADYRGAADDRGSEDYRGSADYRGAADDRGAALFVVEKRAPGSVMITDEERRDIRAAVRSFSACGSFGESARVFRSTRAESRAPRSAALLISLRLSGGGFMESRSDDEEGYCSTASEDGAGGFAGPGGGGDFQVVGGVWTSDAVFFN